MAPQFDPQLFLSHGDSIALQVPASEIFGLLTRSLHLPTDWTALVTLQTGHHVVVPCGGCIESTDAVDVMFVRVSPIDLAFDVTDLVTRDRYVCRAHVRARVSVIPERTELLSFKKQVLGSDRIAQVGGLTHSVQPTIKPALAKFASEHDASDLIEAGCTEALSSAVGDAIKVSCFKAGMTLEQAPDVQVDSQTFRRALDAQREAARRRAEHRAATELQAALRQAQTEHVDHLAALLARLCELAKGSPDVELPELIRTFNEPQRAQLYEALFAHHAPQQRTRWIVVAAGGELMFFHPQKLDAPSRRVDIGGAAGPVRSVQASVADEGAAQLLIGAATGVYRFPVDRGSPDLTLLVSGRPQVRGGFNAVVAVGDRVLASHSELGLCEWRVSAPDAVRYRLETLTRSADTVRHIQLLAGDLFCSIDALVVQWAVDDESDTPAHTYTGSSANITALHATARGVFAGNGNGDVLRWAVGRPDDPQRLHTGSRRSAESLWLVSTSGVERLLFADTSPRVRAQVLGDNFACEYQAGGQTLRRVEVAPDLIVATNDLRDRLFCWTPGRPERPYATLGISSLCGRTVQDVCLVG
ncbi:MAG: SPFH domain-containing protein [Phycisphaerae bacterium]